MPNFQKLFLSKGVWWPLFWSFFLKMLSIPFNFNTFRSRFLKSSLEEMLVDLLKYFSSSVRLFVCVCWEYFVDFLSIFYVTYHVKNRHFQIILWYLSHLPLRPSNLFHYTAMSGISVSKGRKGEIILILQLSVHCINWICCLLFVLTKVVNRAKAVAYCWWEYVSLSAPYHFSPPFPI